MAQLRHLSQIAPNVGKPAFLMRLWLALAGMMVALAMVPAVSFAQSAPAVAPPPGTIGLPTREELEAGAPPQRAPPAAPSRLHVEDSIEHAPCALDAPRYAAIRVRITQATFANLGPVPATALDQSWKGYAGTDQPISVLCRIRDAAATRLRAAGYLAAVEVPVQRITDGQVRFEVLYAKIVAVRVIGHPGRNHRVLQHYLDRLVDGKVFNRFSAERQVLLARDIPGYDIYLTLKPSGTGAGNMIAEMRVENTPFVVDATVSDLAAPATGRFGGQLRATFNGLTGLGDQTTLSAYTTSQFHKQQIWQAGHQMQLGASGLQLAAHLTYAVTRPELGGGLPPIEARTWLFDLAASYPLLRHETGDLRLSGGIDLVNQNVAFGNAELSRDRLRVGFVRLDGTTHDPRGLQPWGVPAWRLSASLELRHGLSIIGATPDCLSPSNPCLASGFVPPSVAIGNPQATVVRASADVEFNPSRSLSLDFGLRGQVASDALYAFEQFSLGNYTVGRGYAPGALVGDKGFAVSTDLRGPVIRLSNQGAIAVQPFVFSDNGWAWRLQAASASPNQVHSLGGGMRLSLGTMAQLDASIAVPLTRLASAAKVEPPLFLLTLSTRFWPWRNR
jgi:hemolysin activation/secretion protein